LELVLGTLVKPPLVCVYRHVTALAVRIDAAGDKQQGFMGSRQWIGAIELGFVLDTLLGVQCKVSLQALVKCLELTRYSRVQPTASGCSLQQGLRASVNEYLSVEAEENRGWHSLSQPVPAFMLPPLLLIYHSSGITLQVITVASGAEMPSKAREIAHHFDMQGGLSLTLMRETLRVHLQVIAKGAV